MGGHCGTRCVIQVIISGSLQLTVLVALLASARTFGVLLRTEVNAINLGSAKTKPTGDVSGGFGHFRPKFGCLRDHLPALRGRSFRRHVVGLTSGATSFCQDLWRQPPYLRGK